MGLHQILAGGVTAPYELPNPFFRSFVAHVVKAIEYPGDPRPDGFRIPWAEAIRLGLMSADDVRRIHEIEPEAELIYETTAIRATP